MCLVTKCQKQFAESWSDAAARKRKKIRIQYGYLTEEGSPGVAATEKKQPRIKKLVCERCSKPFEARRRNTKYCPDCAPVPLCPELAIESVRSGLTV